MAVWLPDNSGWLGSGRAGLLRVLLLLLVLGLSLLAHRVLHLEGLLPVSLFALVMAGVVTLGLRVLTHAGGSALLPLLGCLLMAFSVFADSFMSNAVGASLKLNPLFFALSTGFTLIYLLRDFKFFWDRPFVRIALIFGAINVVYFLFYHSEFQLSAVKAGYQLDFGDDTGSVPIRAIIGILALGLVVATVQGAALFSRVLNQPMALRRQLKNRHAQEQPWLISALPTVYGVYGGTLVLVMMGILAYGLKEQFGMGNYLPFLFPPVCGFWYLTTRFHPQAKLFGRLPVTGILELAFTLMLVFMPLLINKTSLASCGITYFWFFWVTRESLFLTPWRRFEVALKQGPVFKLSIIVGLLLLVVVAGQLGIFAVVEDKIDYFVDGFSGGGTLRIRQNNWNLLFTEWWATLDWQKVLFGYGTGMSRQTIFFLSAMHQATGRTLVQTVHNGYLEYLFDYGLMAFWYFGLHGYFAVQGLKACVHKWRGRLNPVDPVKRMLGASQVATILFIAIYALADGLRVQVLIQYFALLSFLEMLKTAYTPDFQRQLAEARARELHEASV